MVVYSNRNDERRILGRALGTKRQNNQWDPDPSESTRRPASQELVSARRSSRDLIRSSRQSNLANARRPCRISSRKMRAFE
jgi:hypothetical protein